MTDSYRDMINELKAGETFLEKHRTKADNGTRLYDHYSASIRLDVSVIQPEYNLVHVNALRGNSQELISCDVNRDDFIAAVEKAMNVTITKNEDYA